MIGTAGVENCKYLFFCISAAASQLQLPGCAMRQDEAALF
jgi:hypothetical protein